MSDYAVMWRTGGTAGNTVWSATGDLIATCPVTVANWHACNAAYIVRAANAYEPMRAALASIVREFDAGRMPLARDISAARAALARAHMDTV